MHDQNAMKMLAEVMEWEELEESQDIIKRLQLLADYKYDQYQQFSPGRRFIENLALWLRQFRNRGDRELGLNMVLRYLIYISDAELAHLVSMAFPDLINPELMNLVAQEFGIPAHRVAEISAHPRLSELQRRSLYLGLSDGARTNELRRASSGIISNEQIWHAYELSEEKASDMIDELRRALDIGPEDGVSPKFNLVWLIDDFSGSGNTYIRYDASTHQYKGKIKKIFERLSHGDLIDMSHYEVFLVLYVATQQAIDHIEYWGERFTSEYGFKPLNLRVLFPISSSVSLTNVSDPKVTELLDRAKYVDDYYDSRATDKHIGVGGTEDARLGFANCALPLVLSHNTPNNSIYLLWGPDHHDFKGLFPRVSRHREF